MAHRNLTPLQILKYLLLPVTIPLFMALILGVGILYMGFWIASFLAIIILPLRLSGYLFGKSDGAVIFGLFLIQVTIALVYWIKSFHSVENLIERISDGLEKVFDGVSKAILLLFPDGFAPEGRLERDSIGDSIASREVQPRKPRKNKSSQEYRQKPRPITQPSISYIKQRVTRRETQPPPPVSRPDPSPSPRPSQNPRPISEPSHRPEPSRIPAGPTRTSTSPTGLPPPSPTIPPTTPRPSSPDRVVMGRIPSEPEMTSATRSAIPETKINYLHRQMQKEIYECLTKPVVPGRSVSAEVGGIDLLVWENGASTMIEIKTGSDVVGVIREAIGQLLEYRYFRRGLVGAKARFVIVSPLEITNGAGHYLEFLESEYKLKITYLQYVLGSNSFSLPYN